MGVVGKMSWLLYVKIVKCRGVIMSRIVIIGLLMMNGMAIGCGSTTHNVDDPTSPRTAMDVDEAREVVSAYATSLGGRIETDAPPPTSVAEVVAVFKKDDVLRFDQAIDFLNGLQGLESLSMRAALSAYRAGMQLSTSAYFEASVSKLSSEIVQLDEKKATAELSADEETKRAAYQKQVDAEGRLSDALRVLAGESLNAAATLAGNLMAQYPDKPAGYQTMARVHQLRGEWRLYDEKIREAQRLSAGAQSFSIQYQKAYEAWNRNAAPEEARRMLEILREKLSDYVRIQASLVLLQSDIESRYAELEKLKAQCPTHLLVQLAGNAIRQEYETAMAIREALTPAVASESAAAAPEPAPAPTSQPSSPSDDAVVSDSGGGDN